jgi:hypothetical protein
MLKQEARLISGPFSALIFCLGSPRFEDELECGDDLDGITVENKWLEAPVLDRMYGCGAYIDTSADDPGAGYFSFFGDVNCDFYGPCSG